MVVALFAMLLSSACPDADRMVPVPPGPFWMGSDRAERARAMDLSSEAVRQARWFNAELTRQRVSPAAFCIDRHLVTQSEYAAFVAATRHRAPTITREEYRRQGFLVHDYDAWLPYVWRDGRPPAGRGDHPVVLVSTADAAAYCRWRHRGLRLPTETEWEKAARGDDGRIFPWGAEWDPARLNSAASGPGGTTSVTRYATGQSPYGVFDAVGNVFQWTASTARAQRMRMGRRSRPLSSRVSSHASRGQPSHPDRFPLRERALTPGRRPSHRAGRWRFRKASILSHASFACGSR